MRRCRWYIVATPLPTGMQFPVVEHARTITDLVTSTLSGDWLITGVDGHFTAVSTVPCTACRHLSCFTAQLPLLSRSEHTQVRAGFLMVVEQRRLHWRSQACGDALDAVGLGTQAGAGTAVATRAWACGHLDQPAVLHVCRELLKRRCFACQGRG